MIVLDASVVVELLLDTQTGDAVARRIADPALALHVPHLLDVEVAQALRRAVREGEIDDVDAVAAIEVLHGLGLHRHSHEPLLDRMWQLRQNLSAYDAAYVALAEALDAKLLTCDARLKRAPGAAHRVELVART